MGRFEIPDHPEIACIERTGYPSWMQDDVLDDEDDEEDYDREFWGDECEDDLYEETRWSELFF